MGLSVLFSCDGGKTSSDGNMSTENQINVTQNLDKEAAIFKENSQLINILFDSIAYTTISWIETDRVTYTPPKQKPILKGLKLDNYTNFLSNPNTKKYAQGLIQYRDTIKQTASKPKDIFIEEIEKFLKSDLYTKSILKKDSLNLNGINMQSYFKGLISVDYKIRRSIKKATLQFKEFEIPIATTNTDNRQSKFLTFIKNHIWWPIGLLLASLLFHVFQYSLYKKKLNRRRKKQTIREQHSIMPETTAASTLNNPEIKHAIQKAYDNTQQKLIKSHHPDCVRSISLKKDTLQTQSIAATASRSFKNEQELAQFIAPFIERHQTVLHDELRDCISKEQATHKIKKSVTVQDFINGIPTEVVAEKDIRAKIHQFKQSLISGLDITMSRNKLAVQIETLKSDTVTALAKMVRDNLIYYFPFADATGALDDNKKTKAIERDSAIKLSVNPDDVTKATFSLLLQKDDMMQAAIMSYDSFLVPICELKSENFNSTGTKIEQIGPDGTMELEHGRWKIKNKLPIKVL
ncbi:MAG: hypothetical protein ACPGU0_01730 [Marinirhabdus sp.]